MQCNADIVIMCRQSSCVCLSVVGNMRIMLWQKCFHRKVSVSGKFEWQHSNGTSSSLQSQSTFGWCGWLKTTVWLLKFKELYFGKGARDSLGHNNWLLEITRVFDRYESRWLWGLSDLSWTDKFSAVVCLLYTRVYRDKSKTDNGVIFTSK